MGHATRHVKPRQFHSLRKRLEHHSANFTTSGLTFRHTGPRKTLCPNLLLLTLPSPTSPVRALYHRREKHTKPLTKMDQSPPHPISTSRFSDVTGYWEHEHPHNPHGYDSQTVQSLPETSLSCPTTSTPLPLLPPDPPPSQYPDPGLPPHRGSRG